MLPCRLTSIRALIYASIPLLQPIATGRFHSTSANRNHSLHHQAATYPSRPIIKKSTPCQAMPHRRNHNFYFVKSNSIPSTNFTSRPYFFQFLSPLTDADGLQISSSISSTSPAAAAWRSTGVSSASTTVGA